MRCILPPYYCLESSPHNTLYICAFVLRAILWAMCGNIAFALCHHGLQKPSLQQTHTHTQKPELLHSVCTILLALHIYRLSCHAHRHSAMCTTFVHLSTGRRIGLDSFRLPVCCAYRFKPCMHITKRHSHTSTAKSTSPECQREIEREREQPLILTKCENERNSIYSTPRKICVSS